MIILLNILFTLVSTQNIAIIGTGIAGAGTAHYLSTILKSPKITIFEKENRIGGRTF